MTRRNFTLLTQRGLMTLAIMQKELSAEEPQGSEDPWVQLEKPWNEFADDLNHGIFNKRKWDKVVPLLRALPGVCKK